MTREREFNDLWRAAERAVTDVREARLTRDRGRLRRALQTLESVQAYIGQELENLIRESTPAPF